ncbi:hypothetical protein [Flavobacterium phage FL-1]|nr:hypothetical protein [Flavobacterium phage FL-1]
MSKVVPVKDFELQFVKSKGKKGLDVDFFDKGQPNELWSVSSDGQPTDELVSALNEFKEVLAYSLGLSSGWDFAREHNRKNDELLKKAQMFWKQEIERCTVSGITVVGSEENDNMGVKIAGSLKTDLGVVGLPSPIIRFEDTFNNSIDEMVMIGDLAEVAFKKLQEHVWLFIFKGKRGGELPFPEAEATKEKPIGGLNITKQTLGQVGQFQA